jgi:hypothetical protein
MYQTDITFPTIEILKEILIPFVPYSLPLLGSCLQVLEQGSDARIYSSFPINTDPGSIAYTKPPLPFSVIFFSQAPASSRFFCSAEIEPCDPTPIEHEHVLQFLRSFLYEWICSDYAKENSDNSLSGQIIIGSVHSRWIPIAKALGQDIVSNDESICTKFILPPRSLAPDTKQALLKDGDENWISSPIREEDVERVRASSDIPRTFGYINARCHASVCIRDKRSDDPVAWAIQHADGSIGILHVEEKVRGRRLAKKVVRELVEVLRHTPQNLEWNWADVFERNDLGMRFFESLNADGWKKGWSCCWLFFQADHLQV